MRKASKQYQSERLNIERIRENSTNRMNHKVAVIISNWNGRKYLSDCLGSISRQTYNNYRVIFVDNGSNDESVDFVRNNFPNIEVIELQKNTGFAVANNIGIRKAFEDRDLKYIIPLNNDTRVHDDFLRELVRTYNECSHIRGEKVGSVAPKILKFYDDGKIDSAGILVYKDGSAINRGIGENDGEKYNKPTEVFGPSGCACLYSREALEDVAYLQLQAWNGSNSYRQYFDEHYFAYYEDVDLAWRLQLRGWKSVYAPEAQVWHIHSATGVSYSPFKAFHIHRNQYYNLIKNFPSWFLVNGLLFMSYRYWLLIRSTSTGSGPSARVMENSGRFELVKIVLRSWGQVLVSLPGLLKKRKFVQENREITTEDFGKLLRKFEADLDQMIFCSR